MSEAKIVGEVELALLTKVKPNTWNPNRMTPFMKDSLRTGLETDGWLSSQALLVWGKDDAGKVRNVIIDGEHRWTVATELGMERGPMVFLDGVSEKAAKALTIKMNQKRGTFDADGLAALLRDIQADFDDDTALALDLGIDEDAIMGMLAEPEEILPGDPLDTKPAPPKGEVVVNNGTHQNFRVVQMFFNTEEYDEFQSLLNAAAKQFGTTSSADTIYEVINAAHSANSAS